MCWLSVCWFEPAPINPKGRLALRLLPVCSIRCKSLRVVIWQLFLSPNVWLRRLKQIIEFSDFLMLASEDLFLKPVYLLHDGLYCSVIVLKYLRCLVLLILGSACFFFFRVWCSFRFCWLMCGSADMCCCCRIDARLLYRVSMLEDCVFLTCFLRSPVVSSSKHVCQSPLLASIWSHTRLFLCCATWCWVTLTFSSWIDLKTIVSQNWRQNQILLSILPDIVWWRVS